MGWVGSQSDHEVAEVVSACAQKSRNPRRGPSANPLCRQILRALVVVVIIVGLFCIICVFFDWFVFVCLLLGSQRDRAALDEVEFVFVCLLVIDWQLDEVELGSFAERRGHKVTLRVAKLPCSTSSSQYQKNNSFQENNNKQTNKQINNLLFFLFIIARRSRVRIY